MIKFIFKMPFKRGTHAFCMPTRGALYIGRLFIPGIAGAASILPAIVLPFKGYNFRGSLSFDMPANLTAIHNRLRDWSINRIISDKKGTAPFIAFYKLLQGYNNIKSAVPFFAQHQWVAIIK
jgi:hypothetical protein